MAQPMLGIHVGPAGLRGLLPLEFYNSQVVQRGRALLAGARRLARATEIIGKHIVGRHRALYSLLLAGSPE